MALSLINTPALGTINQISTGVAGVSLGAGNASAMKNRLINGAMVIDQRNAGASVTPTNGGYTLDRWATSLSQASKFTVQQNAGSVTPPAGFINYLGATSSSAYTVGASDYFNVQQVIEGYNIADLAWGTANAKTITISFWVYSSLTGTFGGGLKNSGGTRSYPFTYSIPVANTWTQISITIAGDTAGTWVTNNGAGIIVQFGLGVGSTYSGTAGSWSANNYLSATGAVSVVGTSGATFYITGVQLEVGTSATGFEYRQYGQELALCQRYCIQYGNGYTSARLAFGDWGSTTSAYAGIPFPVEMRVAPSLTVTNNGQALIEGTAWYPVTSVSLATETTNKFGLVQLNVASSPATSGLSCAWGAGGVSQPKCYFSAEL
jgi:hypothetical protein